jgi:hypothetical protein
MARPVCWSLVRSSRLQGDGDVRGTTGVPETATDLLHCRKSGGRGDAGRIRSLPAGPLSVRWTAADAKSPEFEAQPRGR